MKIQESRKIAKYLSSNEFLSNSVDFVLRVYKKITKINSLAELKILIEEMKSND